MRYCADAVNVSGQGGSFVMRGDEEISERRKRKPEMFAGGEADAGFDSFTFPNPTPSSVRV